MKEYTDYSLLSHTTFGIEARAARFVEYESIEELQALLPTLEPSRFLQIGSGSNLLFTRDYAGTVLHSGLHGITLTPVDGGVLLRAAAGEVWDDVVAYAVEQGLSGMENLSAIPGEVGASAVQNIGAYGVEAKDLIETVEAIEVATGELKTFTNEACAYGYRKSAFKREWRGRYIIVAVTYRLSRVFAPILDYGNIRSELARLYGADYESHLTPSILREVIISIRHDKLPDPSIQGNAGSFFMNPIIGKPLFDFLLETYPEMPHYEVDEDSVKIPAGWLIDQCGWKGRSMGHVGVHDRQALVLVNLGGAKAEEVVQLCEAIRGDVKQKFGVVITPEVNMI